MTSMRSTDAPLDVRLLLKRDDCFGESSATATEDLNTSPSSSRSPNQAAFVRAYKICYTILDPSKPLIRLLHLQPSQDPRQELVGKLVVADLSSKPDFEALSYVWGSSRCDGRKSKHVHRGIRLEGGFARIRPNLSLALTNLRLHNAVRIIWVDALCINQRDMNERNHQVLQMKAIYTSARRVVVFIGRKFIPRHIGRDEYWGRLWIIQEVLLGRQVIIQCMDDTVVWRDVIEAFHRPSTGKISRACEHIIGHRAVYERQTQDSALPLIELVSAYMTARCQNPKDQIFGLLGLARECCREALEVDYSRSEFDLVAEAMQHYLSHHKNGNIEDARRLQWTILDALGGKRTIFADWYNRKIQYKATEPLSPGFSPSEDIDFIQEYGQVTFLSGAIEMGRISISYHLNHQIRYHFDEPSHTLMLSQMISCTPTLVTQHIMSSTRPHDPVEHLLYHRRCLLNLKRCIVNIAATYQHLESRVELTCRNHGTLSERWLRFSIFGTDTGLVGFGPGDMREGDLVRLIPGVDELALYRDVPSKEYLEKIAID